MTWINQKSTAWEEAKHAAAFLARGHIPLEARCDHPDERELEDGRVATIYGWVKADWEAAEEDLDFLRTYALALFCGMKNPPLEAPKRNGLTDDEDMLAQLIEDRWDSPVEFLILRHEAKTLCKSRPFRRMAVAIYERLLEVEFLSQDELRDIYEQEKVHEPQAA